MGFFKGRDGDPLPERGKPHVVHQYASDSPGYRTLMLAEPIGHTQAGVDVLCELDGQTHTLHLHGQRTFDVPTGCKVTFPDGSTFLATP